MNSAAVATFTRDALVAPAFALLIALPWLNPFASGPSPAVWPWLLALSATAILMLLASLRGPTPDIPGGSSFSRRWASPIACAWTLAGLVSCLIALLQYLGHSPALEPWVNQTPLGLAFANLRQRNQFATLTNLALAAVLWLAVSTRAGVVWRQWGVLGAAGLLAVGNAASSSRTGLLQLVLLGLLVLIWGGWRVPFVRRVLLTAGVAYALAMVALPWLIGLDPFSSGAWGRLKTGDPLCASRLTLWSNVLHLIAQKPWLGWGRGELDYAHYMTLYQGPRFCDILDNAHNLPLHLAVELGLPLALGLCGGLAWWVWRQRPWTEADPTRQLAWAVLALIGLHSLLEYPLWYGPFQMAAGLCVLLLWRPSPAGFSSQYLQNRQKRPLAQVIRALTAIILIAISGYAMWDYQRISQIYLPPQARDAAYRDDTLDKIRGSWLFARQVRFAELSITPLTPANAQWTFDTASALLHYSPEARVAEKVIESAVMLGRDDDALAQLARYRAAFPADYARWARADARRPELKELNELAN